MPADEEDVRPSLNKLTKITTFVAVLAGCIIWFATDHFTVIETRRRVETLEASVKWQNDMLWEIRGDVKVLKERGSYKP